MKKTDDFMLIPLLFIFFLLPGTIWFQQTGNVSLYFTNAVPDGQLLYILSKLLGLYAFFFLMMQVLLSLSCRLQLLQISWMGKLHKVTGSMVFLLALTHWFLFFLAVSFRQDSLAWGLLLPNLSDFYHTHLSFGLIGLWLLLAVVMAGMLRLIRKSAYAPMIHRAYYLSIGLIYVHVLAIGTESQSTAGLVLYLGLGMVFILLLLAASMKQYKMRRAIVC